MTDSTAFAGEIHHSIDHDRPVIAGINAPWGLFRVITGYDGETLHDPSYAAAQNLPESPVTYSDMEFLYVVGEKIPRRFTEKDGLMRIVKVIEYNEAAGLWDEYQQKMIDKNNPDYRKYFIPSTVE